LKRKAAKPVAMKTVFFISIALIFTMVGPISTSGKAGSLTLIDSSQLVDGAPSSRTQMALSFVDNLVPT
jgi:hypothetical protein